MWSLKPRTLVYLGSLCANIYIPPQLGDGKLNKIMHGKWLTDFTAAHGKNENNEERYQEDSHSLTHLAGTHTSRAYRCMRTNGILIEPLNHALLLTQPTSLRLRFHSAHCGFTQRMRTLSACVQQESYTDCCLDNNFLTNLGSTYCNCMHMDRRISQSSIFFYI